MNSNPLYNFANARKKLIYMKLCLASEGQVTSQTALLPDTPTCGSAYHASMGNQGTFGSGDRPSNTGSSQGTCSHNGGGSYRNQQKGHGSSS
jgi:hypothetical protein